MQGAGARQGMMPMVGVPQRAFPRQSTVGIRQDETLPISDRENERREEQAQPIGKKEIDEAREVLQKYRGAKAQMDARFVENENWWRMQHLNQIRKEQKSETDTPSAWLFNSIANKHADAMDNYPSASVLPREASDRMAAEKLTSILPVVLERNDFERTYSECWDYKLKMGMSCYGVFWDNDQMNGLGDVTVEKIDVLNLFWEPGITDLQDSRNVFYTYMVDTDLLEMEYPELAGKLGGVDTKTAQYAYVQGLDNTGKTAVVDWYYRRKNEMGKSVLHLCKFAGEHVLYATENAPETAARGLYDHGRYPFVLDRLHCLEGTLEAFGYIDVMKGVQTRIDRQQCALTKYAAKAMSVRWFKRDNATINTEQYADQTQEFVDVAGPLDEENLRQIKVDPIDGIWVQVLNNNIEELKEVSGNRDVNQGGTTSGVTAASAIAAMMEAGSKLSRDMLKASYRAFQQVCYLVLENIRQFYTEQRTFRITGEDGGMQFVPFSGAEISLQGRMPIFDVTVKAQKSSPYSRMAQNELVKEFYNMGFFNPQQATQSLAALQMMDFDGKGEIVQMIIKNGTMFDQLTTLQSLAVQMTQMIDPDGSKGILNSMLQQGLLDAPGQPSMKNQATGGMPVTNSLGAEVGSSGVVAKAQSAAQESTAPR